MKYGDENMFRILVMFLKLSFKEVARNNNFKDVTQNGLELVASS